MTADERFDAIERAINDLLGDDDLSREEIVTELLGVVGSCETLIDAIRCDMRRDGEL